MRVRFLLRFGTLIGLGVLVVGNLGGCPIDLFTLLTELPGILNPDGQDGTDDQDGQDGTDDQDGDDAATAKPLHQRIFEDILEAEFDGTGKCVACHADHALDILETGHWKWQGVTTTIAGEAGQTHGKTDLINNL
jgi:hypothetical protein